MALTKQGAFVNFASGLDTKSDPNQVPMGKFLALNNSVFTVGGALTKRNGFANITTLPNELQSTLTTLNDNLIATGSNLYAYSQDTSQWLNKGIVQPISLKTLSLVRASTSQTSPDTAVASNGLVGLVYMDSGLAYVQVLDNTTGQQILARTSILSIETSASAIACPRIAMLGNYFIVSYLAQISGNTHLKYIAIPTSNPNAALGSINVSSTVRSISAGYDSVVYETSLYFAWAASTSSVLATVVSSSLVSNAPVTISNTHSATALSITIDSYSPTTPTVWIVYYDSSTTNGYLSVYNQSLTTQILGPTEVIAGKTVSTVTALANDQSIDIFYQVQNTYAPPYPVTGIRTDYIQSVTCSQAGVVGTTLTLLRSVGLASKAFLDSANNTVYMLVAYGETIAAGSNNNSNQPSYFLMDSTGQIYMRLAYSNGGGYEPTQVLPNVSIQNSTYYIPYLITDFLATVNKNTNNPVGTPVNSIYTQTGVNIAQFTINNSGQYSSEIAGALHFTGGQLWMYDGVKPVEHNFQVWPEDVAGTTANSGGALSAQEYFYQFCYEWTDNQGNLHRSAPSIPLSLTATAGTPVTFTASFASNVSTITVSSSSGLLVGQIIQDTTTGSNIAAGTYITAINSSTSISISYPTQGSATSDTLSTNSTASNTLYVPTLRLTSKQPLCYLNEAAQPGANPVRIVGYRWSVGQQVYYEFTSVAAPIINDPTVDYVTIVDTQADNQILGQTILYTTGGVVEDIAAPPSIATALFKSRLFLVDAEDQNLLWYSKQVIEDVPVEMSDLFTLYVAPTSGAQGSTGSITALSAMDDKLIIFKKDAIYYITGTGPDNTGSNNDFSDPIFITSSVGTNNPASIVLMPNGLMFQSDKGIWLLGRDLSTTYIGAGVESYNSQTVQAAQTIPGTNQVRFILEDNTTLVYDYYYSQWSTFSNIRAISSTLYQGYQTYLNVYGQIFQEAPGTYVDGTQPVLLSFTTSWMSLAGIRGYERFYYFLLLGTYYTPFNLNVTLAYDFGQPQQAILVKPDNATPNWGGEALWGSSPNWGGNGNVLSARIFPAKQKCQSFQVTINEIYDASYGQAAGQGLTLSGLNLVVGAKKGYSPQKASQSFG